MSELMEVQQSTLSPEETPSAGKMLRAAREKSGLHIAALAVAMKVPVKKLEALESDRLDLLPDAVFVRALASSVCRTLKVDPVPVLAKLPLSAVPRLGSEHSQINAPYYAPGHERKLEIPVALKKPSVIAVVVLLVAASILVFLPRSQPNEQVELTNQASAGLTAASTEATVGSPATSLTAGEAATSKTNADVLPATDMPKTVVESDPVGKNTSIQPESKVPTPSSAEIVTFKVRGTSWVEVTDAKGIVQLRKTLNAGESVSAAGDMPLNVVVGRTDMTEVFVRGQPFSTDGFSRDNVARFEVR